ncbi:MAG: hypothetical protein JSV56_10735, partial [Methanomassiliicoccales archaeon]
TTNYAIDVSVVQDVLPDYIHFLPSTFNAYPDNITVNETGYTFLEWEVDTVWVGDNLIFTFNVISDKPGLIRTNDVEESYVKYIKWNDQEYTELFPEVWVYVKLGVPSPPWLYDRVVGNDVQLYWDTPEGGADHYLIFKASIQNGFDFSDVWINTSEHSDNGTIPLRTTWNITGAALDTYKPMEEYYIMMAVNQFGTKSVTSNTVGKWTKMIPPGVSSFSLPLLPFEVKTTDWYTSNIPNCNYIKWMNPWSHKWVKHDYGEGPSQDQDVVVGEGYEIGIDTLAPSNNNFTFCGRPGAHIRYMEGELPPPTNFALNIINEVDVMLTWDPVPGADHYIIYKSSTREGLNNLSLRCLWETEYYNPFDTAYIDKNAASIGQFDTMKQCYYMVVAVIDPSLHAGYNSSYSIGVWTEKITVSYDTMGLPLKPSSIHSIDWYCDRINSAVGINYFIYNEQRWGWHTTRMPKGAYDPDMIMAEGYQISTNDITKYSYVGI